MLARVRTIQFRPGAAAKLLFAALLSLVVLLPLPAPAAEVPDTFADLAELLLPSVVNISTTQVVEQSRRTPVPQAPPGSPFEDFFRDFFDRNQPEGGPRRRATSLGSGFIIDPRGFIVTNNHVIADADEVNVILSDDTRHEATVIGRDPKTDLALLKIETGRELRAVAWGDSRQSRVGEWVVAIGNPFGLGGSVTAGIISARQRNINAGPYDSFLQTDASINRGNSGGPLFNMDGEVIGVNTAIFSPSGGSVGIGFSIPSEIAARVISQLQDFGRPRRGWLGVRIQSVTDEIAESLGLNEAAGALVASVSPEGPAELGEIKAGDVILSFNGQPIDEMRDLPRVVADTEIGRSVPVEVWRRGEVQVLSVEVGELDEEQPVLASATTGLEEDQPEVGSVDALGLTLSSITTVTRTDFELSEDIEGVLITDVAADSAAAEKGLRPGDVILEVSQEEVSTPEQVAAKVLEAEQADRRSVLLLVNRDGELRFVAVRVG